MLVKLMQVNVRWQNEVFWVLRISKIDEKALWISELDQQQSVWKDPKAPP